MLWEVLTWSSPMVNLPQRELERELLSHNNSSLKSTIQSMLGLHPNNSQKFNKHNKYNKYNRDMHGSSHMQNPVNPRTGRRRSSTEVEGTKKKRNGKLSKEVLSDLKESLLDESPHSRNSVSRGSGGERSSSILKGVTDPSGGLVTPPQRDSSDVSVR